MVQVQFPRPIKVFCSNNAMEYNKKSFLRLLQQNSTISHLSCPYTSQQNGRIVRKHLHILDTVRSLLIFVSLPEHFREKLHLQLSILLTIFPFPSIHNKTVFELLFGNTPNYSSLRVFGCSFFVLFSYAWT